MNAQLTPTDWNHLIRFAAASDVRTPARFLESMERWKKNLPSLIQEVLSSGVRKAKALTNEGKVKIRTNKDDLFPFRIKTEIKENESSARLSGEIIAGRSLWLWSIKHTLTKTIKALNKHKWTILHPPKGLTWFTSDNPLIRLNYYGNNQYDFKGGWGNNGTELILPLTPYHLLYTKVGQRPPLKGSVVPLDQARFIRRIIAEHAYRFVFAHQQDPEMLNLRPRKIDQDLFVSEKELWENWHDDNLKAEQDLFGQKV